MDGLGTLQRGGLCGIVPPNNPSQDRKNNYIRRNFYEVVVDRSVLDQYSRLQKPNDRECRCDPRAKMRIRVRGEEERRVVVM